jgi:hypothetical protein
VQVPGTDESPKRFQFVAPHPDDREKIRMYSIFEDKLGYDEKKGLLVFEDENVTIKQYSPREFPYDNLIQTLKFAGLTE